MANLIYLSLKIWCMVRVCVFKMGAIGTAVLLEYLLDERAEREDLDVRVLTTGAKMRESEASVAERVKEFDPDLVLVVSPNASLPGPKRAREAFKGIPTIVISDAPAKKITDELEREGFGYILVTADSMIGARREFLDPTEMALYNSYVIRVLANTGALRAVQEEIDRVIGEIKEGKIPELPKLIVDARRAVEAGRFRNPYAMAKALAAYFIAERVAEITTRACFVERDPKVYIPLVCSAHEMMRIAAALSDEAREIEKAKDSVFRNPHARDGRILEKYSLMEKPKG